MEENKREYYLYKSVQDKNILPITSKCNLSCIFCSHRQNPSEVEVIRLGDLKISKVRDLIDYLDPALPIIIGESATKIIEGEPLVHPQFKKIINLIRNQYDNTKIKITTNANLIDDELLYFFENTNKISLNISVNYIDPELREKSMGNNCQKDIFKLLNKLRDTEIEYNFSMVALPHLFGYQKIEDEIKRMLCYDPMTIRVFMPGFTKLSLENLKFDYKKVYQKLSELIKKINLNSEIPVNIEPALIRNLDKKIIGVIKDSPADRAGLKYLDSICEIDSKKPVSRVDAFNKIKKSIDPIIKIKRKENLFKTKIKKAANTRSGIVMDYDIGIKRINKIENIIKNNENKKLLFLTSELGYELINHVIKKHLEFKAGKNIMVKSLKSEFMQGSIISAGLLTNYDVKCFLKNNKGLDFDRLILPTEIYDYFNNDLCGNSYKKLENKHSFEIDII